MEFVFILCFLVGLQSVYSENIEVPTVIEQTITFHTMTLPPQSFQKASVPEVPGQIFVRDRLSSVLPMIFFNNGDIQHIIEEMHFTPRQEEKKDDEDDFDMMIKFFSINPEDEDLGQATKKNRYVETRLPVFLKPIPAQEAPTKFIPQAPSQRTAFQQSSPIARSFNIVPTKLNKLPFDPQDLPFINILPLRKPSERQLPKLEPVAQSESQDKSENQVSPLRDQVVRVNVDGKELNSKEVKDIVSSGVFDRLLGSLTKEPFSSAQSSIEPKKPESKNDRNLVDLFDFPDLKSSSRSTASGPMGFSRSVLPSSSDDLPQLKKERSSAPNVLRLDDIPIELLQFMDFMNDDGESMFSSEFFDF